LITSQDQPKSLRLWNTKIGLLKDLMLEKIVGLPHSCLPSPEEIVTLIV